MKMNQQGYIVPLLMILSFIISILLISLLQVAYFDRRIEHNSLEIMQAQQAADGGAAWACEKISANLLAAQNQESLPLKPLQAVVVPVDIGNAADQVNFTIPEPGAKLVDSGADYGVYEFNSSGVYKNTRKVINVRVKYSFINHYKMDAGGNALFQSRTFLDHGKIISYKFVN
ncbi:hypothetical protein [Syntrophomonas palmitatica]|uniref:hypothetical protein n=1 Tax=Syntrophomonas palmitatica TaxID=402877 RepID=UPI0006D1D5E4|nr:hypothetical protein [Syntrophomonas palmitatica]